MNPKSKEEWADYWAVRLDGGSLTDSEREALALWLDSDPTNRAALSASCQFLTDLEQHLPAIVAESTRAPQHTFTPKRKILISPVIRWALGLGAAAVTVFAVLLTRTHSDTRDLQVPALPIQKIQSIALVDGTRADLNTNTEIKVDFADERQRSVKMDRGEALFTVAKNPARPFVVETPCGSIRVTGTAFNVRIDSTQHLEVTVIEGSVDVIPRNSAAVAAVPLRLGIGDQVAIEAQSISVKRFPPGTAIDVAAWRENRVVFDGVPIKDALRRFRSYQDDRYNFDPEVAALRVGGRFNLDDIDGFLLGIENALPIEVDRSTDGTTTIRRKILPNINSNTP